MSETSAGTTTRTSSTSQSTLVSRLAFGALGLLLFGIVFAYAVLYFGSINGEEFSPDSFKRRRFAYLEIPLIGFQITPITHTDTTNDLEKFLASQKWLPKPKKPVNRWDLVIASRGSRRTAQGESRILSQYLDATDEDGDSIWLTWSEEHTDMAKVLWPAVAQVARQEHYSFVPELFILARSAAAPDQLQQRIHETLAEKYRLTAETFKALDQPEMAAELLAEAELHAAADTESIDSSDP